MEVAGHRGLKIGSYTLSGLRYEIGSVIHALLSQRPKRKEHATCVTSTQTCSLSAQEGKTVAPSSCWVNAAAWQVLQRQ